MIRIHLFRWWRRWQLDIGTRRGWLSVGADWREGVRPILYLSPDATPQRATFNINRDSRD
ncbi:hypothetical protein E1211_17820 [Micromonospora sp. 15K316]|uniref:hypothetical protein n=1 Tax=Micromonospora sp. 15K316 TaxID=2530376 RepID=UPI00104CB770|nr:hypothetical protein [Micromonospora sp. 15K316]TDC34206.1 hypothetical protein E1211_17820 [Micromonospora sp. 15K316]